jgi:5-methylcytosine-specific restriction endonuclease McrA
MSLSKKLRFEVFKRDGFKCQYCGNHPPIVVLEVDHINPVSKGGTNEIDNLVTSCFDCNRGKGNRELTCIPQSTV